MIRTTLEIEARAIRKILAQAVICFAVVSNRSPNRSGTDQALAKISQDVEAIDREADEETERPMYGRDEF
jgi:hypothetical protein